MSEIKKILFPYDLSENAAKILPYVLSVSEKYDSTIYLLHVVHDLQRWGNVYIPHPSTNVFQKEALEAAEKAVDRVCEEQFERPANFDLRAFWETWCAEVEGRLPAYVVRARVAPQVAPDLARYLREGRYRELMLSAPPDGEQEWATVELAFASLEEARARLLPLGGAVEVLEPLPLRLVMEDYGRQIVERYA